MPNLVADYPVASFGTAAASKSVTPTVSGGDMVVVVAVTPDSGVTVGAPSGGGLTYTPRGEVSVSSRTRVAMWTAPVPGGTPPGTSITITITRGGSNFMWGFAARVYSGVASVGANPTGNAVNTAPSLAITTTGANSTIVMANADWVPVDGATRTPRTLAGGSAFAESTYFYDASNYTLEIGHYLSAGAIGAKTVGYTQPTGQTSSIVALELLGSSTTPISGTDTATVTDSAALAAALGGTDTAAVAEVTALTATTTATDAGTLSESASINLPVTDGGVLTETATVTITSSVTDTIALTDSATVLVTLASTDTAAFTDQGIPTAAIAVTDTGTQTETSTAVSAALTATDGATVTDSSSLDTGADQITGSDTAALTETSTLTAASASSDTAALTETATIVVTLANGDTAVLTEATSLNTGSDVTGTDTAVLTELGVLTISTAAFDVGTLTETATVLAFLASSDASTLTDLAAVIDLAETTAGDMHGGDGTAPTARATDRDTSTMAGTVRPGPGMRG